MDDNVYKTGYFEKKKKKKKKKKRYNDLTIFNLTTGF